MDKHLMDIVAKCDCCGKAFLIDLEGDNKTCDYCLAENEMMKLDEKDKNGKY